MSNEKVRPSTNATKNVDNTVELLEWEGQQIALAGGYLDLFAGIDILLVDDFVEEIRESLDKYIDRQHAYRVIEKLNWYISNWDKFKQDFKARHGAKSADYEQVCRIGTYIDSSPPITNIWEMQKAGKNIFSKFLRITSKEDTESILKPPIARMALLRLYISHLTEKIWQETYSGHEQVGMHIIDAFKAGAALNELYLAAGLLDKTTLEKLHYIAHSANTNARHAEKHKDICDDAKAAWNFGCELLHTQMLYLFISNDKIGSKDETCVMNKLKKIAPLNRLYGSGVDKAIDSCPCNKQDQCPLVKKINPNKRYNLPVSRKDLK